MIRLNDSFLRPVQALPPLHSTISFTRNLLTVENSTAFVTVDNHSYFVESEVDEFEDLDNNMIGL